jgi:hypothetical protein
LDCVASPGKKALVVAAGGGGDIASAVMIAKALERLGARAVLGSVAWERYIYDDLPGPIRIDEIRNAVELGEGHALINAGSYADRRGRKVVFQAAMASAAINEPIYIIDLYGGVRGFYRAIKAIAEREGVDFVIGVDAGGDSLASGCEDDLWSPLSDWVALGALALVDGYLAVHSPGSDGELSQEYVLERVDLFAKMGGLVGARAMCSDDALLLDRILSYVGSEASRIPLLAFRGMRGEVSIRNGSRRVKLSLLSTFTFILKAKVVAESIEPVREIMSTDSLYEARGILNSYGIYTELDLEEDLHSKGLRSSDVTGQVLLDTWLRGRERVRRSASRSYCYKQISNEKLSRS